MIFRWRGLGVWGPAVLLFACSVSVESNMGADPTSREAGPPIPEATSAGASDASKLFTDARPSYGSDAAPFIDGPDLASPPGRLVCGLRIHEAVRIGVDVSHHNGTVDWAQARAAGISFAFARVSDGLSYPDTEFSNNYRAMRAAGIVRGAYQYFRPNGDALAQAKYFVASIRAAGGWSEGDLPPVIDIEVTNTTALAQQRGMSTWIQYVQEQLRARPIVYTYRGASASMGGCFTQYPLWIASWSQHDCPSIADAWADAGAGWSIWQHTDSALVPGIPSGGAGVDRNVFNGDEGAFQAMLRAAVIPAGASAAVRLSNTNCSLL